MSTDITAIYSLMIFELKFCRELSMRYQESYSVIMNVQILNTRPGMKYS